MSDKKTALKKQLARAEADLDLNNAAIMKVYNMSYYMAMKYYGDLLPNHAKIKARIRKIKARIKKA